MFYQLFIILLITKKVLDFFCSVRYNGVYTEIQENFVEIFIFGSSARNTRTPESDIDILVQYKSLNVMDINNSVFLNTHLTDLVLTKLKLFSGFELQIVGPYELRFFDYKKIFHEMINLNDFNKDLLCYPATII